jgi:hypothetical protein
VAAILLQAALSDIKLPAERASKLTSLKEVDLYGSHSVAISTVFPKAKRRHLQSGRRELVLGRIDFRPETNSHARLVVSSEMTNIPNLLDVSATMLPSASSSIISNLF